MSNIGSIDRIARVVVGLVFMALMLFRSAFIRPAGIDRLDTKSADSVFELMRQVNRDSGPGFLLVTHNLDPARRCDRIIEVMDGSIRP